MKYKFLLILASLASFTITSCTKDTCNGELGNTFAAITPDSVYTNTEDLVTLSGTMITLDELPTEYFASTIAGDDITATQTHSVSFTKTSFELIMAASAVPAVNENKDLSFDFMFVDRVNYIDCRHSGSADAYYLELAFNLKHLEEDHYEIANFSWNEIFAAGHL